jgi:peptidoglycan/xylan/chitin deacetylase (PgdA/CDA1 family)
MRSYARRLRFQLLSFLGRERLLLSRLNFPEYLLVLNLHSVTPHSNPFWPAMHPSDFDGLLRFLTAHFDVVSFANAASGGGRPAVVLSFDDGLYDFLEYAAPLLHKHHVTANQNVVLSCVQTGSPIWNVQLYDLFESAPVSLVRCIKLQGFTAALEGDDDDSKTKFAAALSRFLHRRSRKERQPLLAEVLHLLRSVEPRRRTRVLGPPEIRALASEHEIGAHSYDHDSMQDESEEFFCEDVRRCETFFTETLRLPLAIYAFPYGRHRNEQVRYLEARGLDRILLVEDKIARRKDRVCCRLYLTGRSAAELRLQALGMHARGGLA